MKIEDRIKEIIRNKELDSEVRLDKVVSLLTDEKYIVNSRTARQLIMVRKKTFSFLWALFWLVPPTLFSIIIGILPIFTGVIFLLFYFLYYLAKKDDTFTVTLPEEAVENNERMIKKEFKNDTHFIVVENYETKDINNTKKAILEQYEPKGYDVVKIDREDSWQIKSSSNGRTYIQMKWTPFELKIEAYNVQEDPNLFNENKKTKEPVANNTDKLIELGKMQEKGLLTKEEFEAEKKKLLA